MRAGSRKIVECAFYQNEAVTSVTVPNGITKINDYFAYACPSLTSVKLPDSVRKIGHGIFEDCTCTVTYKGKTYSSDNYKALYNAIRGI